MKNSIYVKPGLDVEISIVSYRDESKEFVASRVRYCTLSCGCNHCYVEGRVICTCYVSATKFVLGSAIPLLDFGEFM